MPVNQSFIIRLVWLLALSATGNLFAQGTAFFYQGRLNDNGSPATGKYDLRFSLHDAAINGNAIGVAQTNFAVPVTAGLFATNLDFGAVFTGQSNWLSIGVRTNGNVGAFTLLTPRQPLLPVPYAIFANTASNLLGSLSATQLVGTLPSAQLAGNFFGSVNFTNATNSFTGSHFGNGAGLTNLNASALAFGTVADARLSTNVALLNTNQIFSGSNTFTGVITSTGTNHFKGVNNFTNRNNAFTGSFFGNGLVGWIPVYGMATQAVANAGYLLLNTNYSTVTLPTSGSMFVGDMVRITGASAGGWVAKLNSGQSVRGNLASYSNSYAMATPAVGDYQDVAVAADGSRLYRVGNAITGVQASSDAGRNWSAVGGLSGFWQSVACSANGKIVFAVPSGGGNIQWSVDSGVNWAFTGYTGSSVSCNAAGTVLYNADNMTCSGNGVYIGRLVSGSISISTNSGSSWVAITGPVGTVGSLAVSADCTKMVAGASNGLLYASSNRGATWSAINSTNLFWSGAGMTGDGRKFAATARTSGGVSGGVYYYNVDMLPGVTGTNGVSGSQDSTVDLQYLGNNQFMPVGGTGTIWGN